ncbi:MAG: polysaccharide biosynthesis tyrosine autokinase, partial [Bacteroidota bacterium]|nr:polysaccharide biosynthesis tyrosine autokinase [Bacteroidota bacterium]
RKFIGLERKFTLNNEIYTYLLQRRSEAQISKASNSPDNEIIDHAVLFGNDPIRPNIWFNYLIALLLGLIVPAIVINLKDAFNNKIITRDDVKNITEKPIIGHVLHIKEGIPETLMLEKPNSPLTEPFWAIRNRLNYFTAGVKKPVITVSSSFSGEGKTFCTINIATTYALSGTKTILVGFDLRNPKLYKAFNLNNEKGVSTCLLGMTTIEESIHKTAHPNLDIMLSGPIPDNPAQLISSLRTPALINKLKEKYDCIVIDSSPLGLVSETLYLSRLSDANILIARQSVTDREELKNCLMEAEVNEINNLSILINDVRIRKNFYRYGYSDKYGYGYKYQHNHIGQN